MSAVSSDSPFTTKQIQRVYGTPFTHGNKVTLLWKGKETFQKIFEAVRSAKELLCLEFYIFRDDETGHELSEIMKKKASEGVKVYILYDHFGSFGTPLKFWKSLKKAGIHVRASRPFKWTSPFQYVYRDHKKLIIIDGQKAFTGGLNIANEYRGYYTLKRKSAWRDTGIFLEGPIAKSLLDIFKKSWIIWKGCPIRHDKHVEPFQHGLPAVPIFASSAKSRRRMRKLLYYSINKARKSIYFTTAYFTPSRRMLQVLGEAVSRGVKVSLLLPGRSDIFAAHYAGRASFTKLLKAGVQIFNYNGDILHAKTAVFDEAWSVIGSANLDFRSLRINDEGNVGIIDTGFAHQMIRVFQEDLQYSKNITLEKWLRRPFHEKIKERFFSMFRRRL